MTHSPLPWKLIEAAPEPYQYFLIVSADGGVVVGDDDDRSHKDFKDDDLRLIVTAVNAHAALVAALEAIIERSRNDPLGTSKVIDMRNIALAALELARKGGA